MTSVILLVTWRPCICMLVNSRWSDHTQSDENSSLLFSYWILRQLYGNTLLEHRFVSFQKISEIHWIHSCISVAINSGSFTISTSCSHICNFQLSSNDYFWQLYCIMLPFSELANSYRKFLFFFSQAAICPLIHLESRWHINNTLIAD